MALHEQSLGATDEWYTPAHVFEAMGVRFDLDVSAPRCRCPAYDWCDTAFTHDSLTREWFGFVWMNPPFGGRNGLVPWLRKFFTHGRGVALVPDRTSAPWWQDFAPQADALLFVRSKIRFLRPDGTEGASPAQGTTLMGAGTDGIAALRTAASRGLGFLLTNPAGRAALAPEHENGGGE